MQLARLIGERIALRIIGAGLLIASAAIHLDLYLTGYRTIPTIGWLFLLQAIAGILLGLAVLLTGSRLIAAAAALFALATLGGYMLSLAFGLFGFREVRTTPGIVTGILEILAFFALALLAVTKSLQMRRRHKGQGLPMPRRITPGLGIRPASAGATVISLGALGLLAAALAFAGGSGNAGHQGTAAPGTAGGALRSNDVHGTKLLANSAGQTLYWFAPDPRNKSVCYGTCARYWPPVAGPLKAGHGVHGSLGTIRRTDGSLQETYNGRPLYTYVGDSGPGQASGNNINLNGGYWYDIPVRG